MIAPPRMRLSPCTRTRRRLVSGSLKMLQYLQEQCQKILRPLTTAIAHCHHPDRLEAFSNSICEKLESGDTQARKAYLGSVISHMKVGDDKVRIVGDKATLAAVVAGRQVQSDNVRGFVRKWHTICGRNRGLYHSTDRPKATRALREMSKLHRKRLSAGTEPTRHRHTEDQKLASSRLEVAREHYRCGVEGTSWRQVLGSRLGA
jgi:hypothetical protein